MSVSTQTSKQTLFVIQYFLHMSKCTTFLAGDQLTNWNDKAQSFFILSGMHARSSVDILL